MTDLLLLEELVYGKIGQTTVGYLPREIRRYIWNALQNGAVIMGNVTDATPRVSPLVQRGLEIKIVLVSWDDTRRTNILKGKLDIVDFKSYRDEYMRLELIMIWIKTRNSDIVIIRFETKNTII